MDKGSFHCVANAHIENRRMLNLARDQLESCGTYNSLDCTPLQRFIQVSTTRFCYSSRYILRGLSLHIMATRTSRRAGRRTDDHTPGKPKVEIVTEQLQHPLKPFNVLIKVHAVALNYRDANIANGGNPWPVTPKGILCNDAAGEVIAIGNSVTSFQIGDRAGPITDTENITGRETGRSWLAANEDGVLADYIIFEERCLTKLPTYLPWEEASIIPCAGVTAWSALKGLAIGQSVLIQGVCRFQGVLTWPS